jgi:hypothetical protein
VSSPEGDDAAATDDSAAAAAAADNVAAAAAAGPRQVNGTAPSPNWLQWDRRSGYGFIAGDKLLVSVLVCCCTLFKHIELRHSDMYCVIHPEY